MEIKGRKLNYRFAKKDPQDFQYRQLMHLEHVPVLPPEAPLWREPFYFKAYDQMNTGSCTGQAGVADKTFITRRYLPDYPDPSRMGFYYSERMAMGDVKHDTGSDGKTSAEVMKDVGVGPESMWPYDDRTFNVEPPHSAAYFEEARKHRIAAYYFLKGEYQTKKCLAAGYPFVFGMNVPQQLMDDSFNGYLENISKKDIIYENGQAAGHQLSCFGYSTILPGRPGLWFLIRNSWGTNWGLREIPGHFWMQDSILLNDSWVDDLITYRLAKEPAI